MVRRTGSKGLNCLLSMPFWPWPFILSRSDSPALRICNKDRQTCAGLFTGELVFAFESIPANPESIATHEHAVTPGVDCGSLIVTPGDGNLSHFEVKSVRKV